MKPSERINANFESWWQDAIGELPDLLTIPGAHAVARLAWVHGVEWGLEEWGPLTKPPDPVVAAQPCEANGVADASGSVGTQQ